MNSGGQIKPSALTILPSLLNIFHSVGSILYCTIIVPFVHDPNSIKIFGFPLAFNIQSGFPASSRCTYSVAKAFVIYLTSVSLSWFYHLFLGHALINCGLDCCANGFPFLQTSFFQSIYVLILDVLVKIIHQLQVDLRLRDFLTWQLRFSMLFPHSLQVQLNLVTYFLFLSFCLTYSYAPFLFPLRMLLPPT